MRLIDAEPLEELLREVIGRLAHEPSINKDMEYVIRASAMSIQMINDAPTVNDPLAYYPECDNCKNAINYIPIKGEWLKVEHNVVLEYTEIYKCSCCGFTIQVKPEMLVEDHKYCSRCGADMKGEKNA